MADVRDPISLRSFSRVHSKPVHPIRISLERSIYVDPVDGLNTSEILSSDGHRTLDITLVRFLFGCLISSDAHDCVGLPLEYVFDG